MISVRPITHADTAFLYRVYASTRTEELAQTGWDEASKQAFLRMQFDVQSRHYAQHYPGADFSIIERDGEPIGRLYVDRRPNEIRIIDIAILPEHRGCGIGTRLLRSILEDSASADLRVTLHVEQFNQARRLYQRLGFKDAANLGIYQRMEWRMPGHHGVGALQQDTTQPA
jgi:ribosomal protein S18 acetylase RimI-like enzyme